MCQNCKKKCNLDIFCVYATNKNNSVCNRIIRQFIHCQHEEADTKIFVHIKHAIENDHIASASIYANDTDIIILAIAFFHELCSLGLSELWVSFGRGKSTVWYPIHIYANNIGVFKSKALLFFSCTQWMGHCFCFQEQRENFFSGMGDIS